MAGRLAALSTRARELEAALVEARARAGLVGAEMQLRQAAEQSALQLERELALERERRVALQRQVHARPCR